jgi:uncharacterized membrane protein YgdD (TMEM256/DUF423 family)
LNVHPAKLGAALAFFGVVLGAFGAHVLNPKVSEDALRTFDIGVRFQFYGALGLLAVGVLPRRSWRAAPWLFWGSVIFSGSLYVLALSGLGWLGAVAPLGGALLLVGWAVLFFSLPGKRFKIED